MLELGIQAAFAPSNAKIPLLKQLRTLIEIEKHIIRNARELHIINDEKYIAFEIQLIEISKMAYGWMEYLIKNGR